MDRLISLQAAIDVVTKHYRAFDNDLLKLIVYEMKRLPSAQPEIIMCKDCIHIHDNDCPIDWGKTDYDFCSYAERRADGFD